MTTTSDAEKQLQARELLKLLVKHLTPSELYALSGECTSPPAQRAAWVRLCAALRWYPPMDLGDFRHAGLRRRPMRKVAPVGDCR